MRITKSLLILLISLASPAFGQDIDPAPEVDPPPVREDGEYEPEFDTDGDGTLDCNDNCPNDPDKIEPGQCGCGVPDTDTDGDGTAD